MIRSIVAASLTGLVGLFAWAPAQAVECYRSDAFFVAADAAASGSGLQFAIVDQSIRVPKGCAFVPSRATFTIGTDEANLQYEALKGRTLILTRGSKDSRDLVVYNLTTREKILDARSPNFAIDDVGLTFYEPGEATAENCSNLEELKAKGGTPILMAEGRINFEKGIVARKIAGQCVAAK